VKIRVEDMSTLERAIAIAAEAHEGAVDKADQPYILHPLRVMLAVNTTDERITAVLHDVLEDTHWTVDRLRQEGFSETVLQALELLTKRKGEDYNAYLRRAGSNLIARRVKLADLADNMDPSRISTPTEQDRERLKKYKAAVEMLKAEGTSRRQSEAMDSLRQEDV
jgi:(p)ppGpp synthase/HD superfamily hydrolase